MYNKVQQRYLTKFRRAFEYPFASMTSHYLRPKYENKGTWISVITGLSYSYCTFSIQQEFWECDDVFVYIEGKKVIVFGTMFNC